MIHVKTQDIFPLLLSVQYTYTKNTEYDYSNQPRPCHNFVFMLDGEGIIQTSGETIRLEQGSILYIPKNTTYKSQWIANPKTVFHSLHFSFPTKNDPLANKTIPIQLLDNTKFDTLYRLLKEIEQYQFSKKSDSLLAISGVYGICGGLFHTVQFEKTKPVYNKSILSAIVYIEQNYTKTFTVDELAKLCYLSPSRFYYLFKKQTGVSPIVYKNKIAIQNAAQELLCNKELSISEIAKNHGFASPIYFERLFKKMLGKTPSQYRKEEYLV